jgi:tetratricopeptide (TPR) repeat protein
LQAGERAKTEFANDIAITSFEHSLEATEALGEDQDVSREEVSARESLGEVLTLVGRYDDAMEHYGNARELVETKLDTKGQILHLADLHRKTADVFERQSEYDNAHEWLETGLAYLDEDAPSIEAVRLYILKTGVYYRQGKYDEAIPWGEKSLAIAPQIETREGQEAAGQAYYLMGGMNIRLGELERAAELSKHSVEVYKSIDHIVGQARAYNNLGSAYTALSKWDLASEAQEKSLAIFRKIGDIQEQGFVTNNLGNIYLNRGDWDHAATLFSESNDIWKRIGAPLPDAVTSSNLAQVHIYQGDLAAAKENLEHSHSIFTDIGSEGFLPELERRWGEYYLLHGEMDQAMDHVTRSIELATEQESRLELGLSFRMLGRIQSQSGELEEAEMALIKSLEILTDLKSECDAARTIISLAQLALLGRVAIDRLRISEAIQVFEELGAEADLIKAREVMELVDERGL